MDKKSTGIVAYITPIGWIIAMCAGDREGAKFQLNQTLVLWIAEVLLNVINAIISAVAVSILSVGLSLVGSLIVGIGSLFCFVCWIIGIIGACQGQDKAMPLFGSIKILK